jgi:hypothetical protein
MLYNGLSLPECECNETSGTGLPCCHLIALFKQLGNDTFPVQLIARQLIPNFEGFALPELSQLTLEQLDFIPKIPFESSSDDEYEGPPPESPIQYDPIRAGRDTNTRKYNHVMMVLNAIAQRA